MLLKGGSLIFPMLNTGFLGARGVAVGIVILGLAILLWAGLLFKREKTTVNPFRPKKTTVIVADGPYRFSRNPMYLGMILIILGAGIYIGTALTLPVVLAFWIYINETQIKPEERALSKMFGQAFIDYMGKVRRWI